MRWDQFRRSDNVEDRRDDSASGGFGMPVRTGGLGIGTILVLGLIGWALGIDPRILIGGAEILSSNQAPSQDSREVGRSDSGPGTTPNDQSGQFVAAVLGDTEDRWGEIFRSFGQTYESPKLVMFSGVTRSACGTAQSAMGPFYCPNDRHVYLDTDFFRQIQTRFQGCRVGSKACEFSQAYVITHEVGHHVQNLLGILPKVQQMQASVDRADANQVQVRVELQADCLAGVWANHSQAKWKFLEPGDIEAALQTASAIGDDTLQKRAQGYVVPDAFTHGTSEQRQRWFTNGLKTGTIQGCDTFAAAQL
jgi:predicted metalloprotease